MTSMQSEDEARAFVATRCKSAALSRLETFVSRLLDENTRQNLVSNTSLSSIWLRHIADSAQLLDHVPRETGLWLDLGSGAGFPGLVLAIMHTDRPFILVESRKLRVNWLRDTIASLSISNCSVEGLDLEKVSTRKAAVISARAFAPLSRLIAQSARFSTTQTRWVLPKGRSAQKEVNELPTLLRPMFHVKQSVTDGDAGIVVGLGKVEISA